MAFKELLHDWIVDDWRRKVYAIFFAIIIWTSITVQIQDRETIGNIRVRLICPPELEILNADDIPTIAVTVRGSKRSIQNVTSNNIRVQHEIRRDTATNTYDAYIRPKDIDLPGNLRVVDIEPDRLRIHLDQKIVANLPVRVRFSGQPPPGMDRKSVVTTPATVRVSGPGRTIAELQEIPTAAITLDHDIPSSFEIDVPLVIPFPDLINVSPKSVTVSVEMVRSTDERYFEDIPVNVMDVPNSPLYVESYLDSPRPRVRLVVEGPKTTIDYLTASSVRAFIDISDIREPDQRTLPIRVHIGPKDCRVRDASLRPDTLRVKIGRRLEGPPAPEPAPAPAPEPAPPAQNNGP